MRRQLILAFAVIAMIGGAVLGSTSFAAALPGPNGVPSAATVQTVDENAARVQQAGYYYRPRYRSRRYYRPYYRPFYRYRRPYYRPFVPFYRPYRYRRPFYYGRPFYGPRRRYYY